MVATFLQQPQQSDSQETMDRFQTAVEAAGFVIDSKVDQHKQKLEKRVRRLARMAGENEYFKKQVIATRGEYEEEQETKLLQSMPRFTTSEIYCGDKLGNGAFGTVYEVLNIVIDQTDTNDETHQARKFMAQHCLRDAATSSSSSDSSKPKQDARYAIKKLRSKIIRTGKNVLQQALVDVATETRILASIPHHPNIIKLRGIASSPGSAGETSNVVRDFPACCFHEDYFVVLDRLYGTLEDRLAHWTKEASPNRVGWKQLFGSSSQRQLQKVDHTFYDRLVACVDLASALAHLHKHNIIHRDIKPPNVGFNIRGDLTVFDFGLSRELPSTTGKQHNADKANSSFYRMTGFCGSPRYMAPEVGLRKVYNAKCDVYSFGALAWQILTLQKPYDGCDIDDLKYVVWPAKHGIVGPIEWILPNKKGGHRSKRRFSDPDMHKKSKFNPFHNGNKVHSNRPKPISNEKIAEMIDRTFKRNINARPTMKELEDFLRSECKQMEKDNTSNNKQSHQLPISRRRSTYVFLPSSKELQSHKRPSRRSSVPVSPSTTRKYEDSTHFRTVMMVESSDSSSYGDGLTNE